MVKVIVIPENLDVLPFQEALGWERYQRFCTDVLAQREGIADSREFLSQGSKQYGVDIYATLREGDKYVVAQCKREQYLSPSDLINLVDEFLAGQFAAVTADFIVCTTYDLEKHTKDAVGNARQLLKSKGIELILWDQKGLSGYLRVKAHVETVYRYFGEEVTRAFYGTIWDAHIASLRQVPKRLYSKSDDYIERFVIAYLLQQDQKGNSSASYTSAPEKRKLVDLVRQGNGLQGVHIVLLSIAGFGKTEELNQLAAYFSDPQKPLHPIRYFLRDYESQSIETLLENYHPDWRNIPASYRLLLFDGLDEMREEYVRTFYNHLNAFVENNPLTHVVVSSRFNFYDLQHPPLRAFDVYVLEPIDLQRIQSYVQSKLPASDIDLFVKKLVAYKFDAYLSNPYYLTRLIRFYDRGMESFPRNKTELFQKILFEQLEADEGKLPSLELQQEILPVAQKVAFCMTLTGKTSLSNEELRLILPDKEASRRLRHFRILNQHEAGRGSWSFEHKNLQEYLCALFLAGCRFEDMHQHISFSFDRNRLLPRFLNTISFLFEILDRDSKLFGDLVGWLQEGQQELFVRFEREQLEKAVRQDVFKSILAYYREKEITIRQSNNFYLAELSAFADIDAPLIDHIAALLDDCNDELAHDLVTILASTKKSYLYKDRLVAVYRKVANTGRLAMYVRAHSLFAMVVCDPEDYSLFDLALESNVDFSVGAVRAMLIRALEFVPYFDSHADFILDSLPVYERWQNARQQYGVYATLKGLLLKLRTATSAERLLQFCIDNRTSISLRRHKHQGLQFTETELAAVFDWVISLSPAYPSLVEQVFQLFLSEQVRVRDLKLMELFIAFFDRTWGWPEVFYKLYRARYNWTETVFFATQPELDFLIEEVVQGNLTDQEIIVIRNNLRVLGGPRWTYFGHRLNAATYGRFAWEEPIDIIEVHAKYGEKNQLFLLDRGLFLQEAEVIFQVVGKSRIRAGEVYDLSERDLMLYGESRLVEAIHTACGDGEITLEEFVRLYMDDEKWGDYVLDELVIYLQQDPRPPLKEELIAMAHDSLFNALRQIDFTSKVQDDENGGVIYFPYIERIKLLYYLLDIPIADELQLKLLETDFTVPSSTDDQRCVNTKIIRSVKDIALLKRTIMGNIRSGRLAGPVLANHFVLCEWLDIAECLSFLFQSIIHDRRFKGVTRHRLTDCYIALGGDVLDFSTYLKNPLLDRREKYLTIEWEFYLLDVLKEAMPDRVAEILFQLCASLSGDRWEKIKVLEMLFNMGRIEALREINTAVREGQALRFDNRWLDFRNMIARNPAEQLADELISLLAFSLGKRIFTFSGETSIQESAYTMLATLAIQNAVNYQYIRGRLVRLLDEIAAPDLRRILGLLIRRLDESFYSNHEYEVKISDAVVAWKILAVK